MKTSRVLFVFVPLAFLHAGAASAGCAPGTLVEHKNGENYCLRTSDGAGDPYRPSRITVTTAGHGAHGPHTKAEAAVALAKRLAHHWY